MANFTWRKERAHSWAEALFQIEKVGEHAGTFITLNRQGATTRDRDVRFVLLSPTGRVGFRQRNVWTWNCLEACNSRR